MADNTFVELTAAVSVSPGPTNIGVIDTRDGICLIDSGNDKDAGRKLLKALRERGKEPKAVINTHSNADHIGANSYLQNNAGCKIWSPETEAAFTETPMLEASFLWGGYPFKELRSKFFEAKASKVDVVINSDTVLPGFSFIPLPGHFFNQFGIMTADGVFFLGDSLFGGRIIEKYGLPFIFDAESYIASIKKIMTIEAEFYVPSHGDIVKDISETAELNLEVVSKAESDILNLLDGGLIFEDLLKAFCDGSGINLNHGQYVLVGSTIKSFLSYMHDNGKINFTFKDNKMYWKSV